MKNSWINCRDKLPSLHYISDTWWLSSEVLAYLKSGHYTIGHLSLNMHLGSEQVWETGDHRYALENILYWQPLEKPLLEDLRDTQNYYLST